jgi:alpha-glucosidase
VSLDEHGRAEGRLYEDAGDGFGYRDGDYLLTTYEATRENGEVRVRVAREEGKRAEPRRELRIHIL